MAAQTAIIPYHTPSIRPGGTDNQINTEDHDVLKALGVRLVLSVTELNIDRASRGGSREVVGTILYLHDVASNHEWWSTIDDCRA